MPAFSTSAGSAFVPLSLMTHSISHLALPIAQIAIGPPGGMTGIAPVDSPSPPTEEMTTLEDGDGAVGFERRFVKWLVMLPIGVAGDSAGSEGVRRPCFGSRRVEQVRTTARSDDSPDTATPMTGSRRTSSHRSSPLLITLERRTGCSSNAISMALTKNVRSVVFAGKPGMGSRLRDSGMSDARYEGGIDLEDGGLSALRYGNNGVRSRVWE